MDILLYICAAISTIGAAITVIGNLGKKAKSPWDSIVHRITAAESKLTEHDRHLALDLARLNSVEEQSAEIMKALLALLSHAVDGNNTERCREAEISLQHFLAKRIAPKK